MSIAEPQSLNPERWPEYRAGQIVTWQRAAIFVVGLVLVAMLVTAAILPPSPRGMGTHQQLGLPPCSIVMWFNVRCPACGMTTSWSHFVRGQIVDSARANTGGLLLAILAVIGAPWMLTSAVMGRWWMRQLTPEWVLIGGSVVFLVTFVQWTWRLLT